MNLIVACFFSEYPVADFNCFSTIFNIARLDLGRVFWEIISSLLLEHLGLKSHPMSRTRAVLGFIYEDVMGLEVGVSTVEVSIYVN